MPTKLFITIYEGVVNDVVCSDPNLDLEVHVLDYDNYECGEEDIGKFDQLEAEMEKYKQEQAGE
jgi:hypothetical protein